MGFIWSAALPGAGVGLDYFFRFQWESLYDPGLWANACAQTLFSLIFLPGSTLTLASHMKPKEDVYRIHRLVALGNFWMSLVCALTVFCIVGHVHHESCTDTRVDTKCRAVNDIAQRSGAGSSFVALAEGIARIGGAGSNTFSFFFFLMCFLL